jgi:glycosyltransferase involved in cell wall biosynthesis
MRIAIDGRELLGRPTGVGRYLRELIGEWLRVPHDHQLVVYVPRRDDSESEIGLPDRGAILHVKRVGLGAGTRWEQATLGPAVNADKPDVLFAPAYTAPLGCRIPIVQTIHDISFVARPEWFKWPEGPRRRWVTRLSARRAAAVITDSSFSKREIVARLSVPEERVTVIPIGVRSPGTASPGQSFEGHQGGRERLVLFAGSILNRRHVPDLIAAFSRVAGAWPDARLIVAGDDRTYPPQDLAGEARKAAVADRVSFRSYVTDEELGDLYRRASVFVFLSEYEGFGLPPLEAMAAGVPPILLDTPVAREVCQDAAVYVQPGDIAGTAAAIMSLLADETARTAVMGRAPHVLGQYSWERAALATLAVLERAGVGEPSQSRRG